ncbi:hypothetical protein P9112_013312 [Eukaryota sp. TZLM1-RC]
MAFSLLNYYALHASYFLVMGTLGSVLFLITSPITLSDSIFTSFSAITCTGLLTYDVETVPFITQLLMLLLIQSGSMVFLTIAPVIIRRSYIIHRFKDVQIVPTEVLDRYESEPEQNHSEAGDAVEEELEHEVEEHAGGYHFGHASRSHSIYIYSEKNIKEGFRRGRSRTIWIGCGSKETMEISTRFSDSDCLTIEEVVLRDLAWIFFSLFAISATTTLAGVLFPLFFEIASAYGNVGLSLGWPGVEAAFVGVLPATGQLILIITMLAGRQRGLPTSLDVAVTTRTFEGMAEEVLSLLSPEQLKKMGLLESGYTYHLSHEEEVEEGQEKGVSPDTTEPFYTPDYLIEGSNGPLQEREALPPSASASSLAVPSSQPTASPLVSPRKLSDSTRVVRSPSPTVKSIPTPKQWLSRPASPVASPSGVGAIFQKSPRRHVAGSVSFPIKRQKSAIIDTVPTSTTRIVQSPSPRTGKVPTPREWLSRPASPSVPPITSTKIGAKSPAVSAIPSSGHPSSRKLPPESTHLAHVSRRSEIPSGQPILGTDMPPKRTTPLPQTTTKPTFMDIIGRPISPSPKIIRSPIAKQRTPKAVFQKDESVPIRPPSRKQQLQTTAGQEALPPP